MSKPIRRRFATVDQQWRKPEYEAHINQYPFGLASLIAGGVAVLIGLMISFVLIISVWLLAAHGTESTLQVIRAAAVAWQSAHLIPIQIGGIPLGVLPMAFIAVPVVIIWKAMHWALKSAQPTDGRKFWLIALYFSGTYGLLSGVISLLSSTDGLGTSVIQTLWHTALIALIVSVIVLVDFAPSPTLLTDRLPKDLVTALRPGLVAFTFFWFISAVFSTVALVVHFNEIKAVAGLMAPSALDQVFLILLCIGYLPTVITWTFSYLLGAGIHLGSTSIITTSIATPGALPAFPVLAVLPTTALPWAKYLVLIPILIGVLIYLLLPRQPWRAEGQDVAEVFAKLVRLKELIQIFLATLILAISTFLVTALSSGPLGSGYLDFIGPNPIEAFIWVFKLCGLAALLTLILPRLILTGLYWWANREPKTSKSVD